MKAQDESLSLDRVAGRSVKVGAPVDDRQARRFAKPIRAIRARVRCRIWLPLVEWRAVVPLARRFVLERCLQRAVFGAGLLLVLLATGCSRPEGGSFQGYLEAEYVYVAAPLGGTLMERQVNRGETVVEGAPLFTLERESEKAGVAEAEGRLAQSRARLEDLRKGRRPSEIAALEARLSQASATLALSENELKRRERLRREDVVSLAELDQARSQHDADRALVDALAAELETARLGGRVDEVRAVENEVATADAALRRARWAFDQKARVSPVAGQVQDTLFEPGEFVSAGAPVVVLLPPANLKARFFVPQAELSRAALGTGVEVSVDGLATPVPATVRYVSTKPEFTPPVIFSRETRQKLVFLVEAAIDPGPAATLRPGQPVDVRFPQ